MMTLTELRQSLEQDTPPAQLDELLQALWYDAKGDWHSAHRCAQNVDSTDGSRVHAYLHRKEGDLSNARYWYTRAGRTPPAASVSLQQEWQQLATELLR
jgi:hypothetical protein